MVMTDSGIARLSYSAASIRNTTSIDIAISIGAREADSFSCSDYPVHFNPFRRGDDTRVQASNGSGLGLAVVDAIARGQRHLLYRPLATGACSSGIDNCLLHCT